MSSPNQIPQGVWRSAFGVADKMEPLKKKKNPTLAAVCGFALGGVGLGIYLESWLDFFVPFCMLLVIVVLGIPTGETLTLVTPVFWAIYGYRRAKTSNEKLEGRSQGGIIEAEIIADPPPIRSLQKIAASAGPPQAPLRRLDDLLREGILSPSEHAERRVKLLQKI